MRRAILIVAVGSIAISAALGVYALLAPGFGDAEAKILGTSLLVTLAAALSLALAPAVEHGRLGWVPHAGIGAAVAGCALLVAGVWGEFDAGWIAKLGISLVVVAAAIGLASLLSVWDLTGRARYARPVTYALAAASAAMIVAGLWGELGSSVYWRAFGIVAVLLAAGILVIPILHRYGPEGRLEQVPVAFCPFCGSAVGGPGSCDACGRRFDVRRR
jgi:hypothetical protein